MRVLFICSGNNKYENSPIVSDQGNSLILAGVNLEYFVIRGKGALGYMKNFFALRRYLKKSKPDIVHAHYSLSGFLSALAGAKPLVVSLMGSDVHRQGFLRWLVRKFSTRKWTALIVKSEKMKDLIGISSACVIPNGVDLACFQPRTQSESKRRVGFDDRKHVVFVGNSARPEKNYPLAQEAIRRLGDNSVVLFVVTNTPHEKLPDYLNAADVLLLTSIYEGSPNVIKEAMACNCPIVATNVGDIEWITRNTEGCFLTSFSPDSIAANLKKAIDFNKRTNGRQRLFELKIDSGSIAKKIIGLYEKVLDSQRN